MADRIDIDAIRRGNPLSAIVQPQVRLHRAGNELRGCCPFHPDKSPSFYIFDGGRHWVCFGCGASGDVLDYVQRLHGVGLVEAARMLGAQELPLIPMPQWEAEPKPDRSDEARAIWRKAMPAAGTDAEVYLRGRGIHPPFPSDIGFARLPYGNLGDLPAMVCAVRDVSGEVTGVQRVFLAHDGNGKADVAKAKLSLGRVAGGAIRMADLDGSSVLSVCEGPEDGLSLVEMLGGPVWVAAGAGMMPAMKFPIEVQRVVIGADNDPAGREAARKAAQAFTERGIGVRIIYPADGHKDFNAELMRLRS